MSTLHTAEILKNVSRNGHTKMKLRSLKYSIYAEQYSSYFSYAGTTLVTRHAFNDRLEFIQGHAHSRFSG